MGGHDVIAVVENLRVSVGGIRQLVEGEVGRFQRVVGTAVPCASRNRGRPRPHALFLRVGIAQCGIDLIFHTVVGPGVEMATGAGQSVAARLLVPEEGLAQHLGGVDVGDEVGEVRRQRHRDGRQSARRRFGIAREGRRLSKRVAGNNCQKCNDNQCSLARCQMGRPAALRYTAPHPNLSQCPRKFDLHLSGDFRVYGRAGLGGDTGNSLASESQTPPSGPGGDGRVEVFCGTQQTTAAATVPVALGHLIGRWRSIGSGHVRMEFTAASSRPGVHG